VTAPPPVTTVASAPKPAALPVSPSAKATPAPAPAPEHWSASELALVKTQLLAELADMQGEYDRSMDELNVLHQAGTDGAGDDQADAGSKTFEREQELSIAANRFDLLNQIHRAIERVDAGTYGLCESCGLAIPKARLKAFPMATLDVACKQREERR
jgi:RNA polymerase-binding protein DksA